MKKCIPILILFFFLNGCSEHIGAFNIKKTSLFTSALETENGGSISSHIYFGKSSLELLNIAKARCKKIHLKSKVRNLRKTFHGNIITDQMNVYKYDCKIE